MFSVGSMSQHRKTKRQEPKQTKILSTLTPGTSDVLVAIWSLYSDELRPFGRILRKRVAEIHAKTKMQGRGCSDHPDVDGLHLKNVCEQSDLIHIEAEEGGDWTALLKGVEEKFVDVYSPHDGYLPEFWDQATSYFQQLPEALPGGRYSCAKILTARRLPFLDGFSLGKICHVVQVAISQRKILGYHNGTLVPYRLSRDMLKEQCAFRQQPCGGNLAQAPSTVPVATLPSARSGLRTLLQLSSGSLPLSNVKRLFRSRFRLELSETFLGHSKLCELLQDKCFQDICEVRLEGNGYTVLQACNNGPVKTTISLVEQLCADHFSDQKSKCFHWPENTNENSSLSTDVYGGVVVQNTFLQAVRPRRQARRAQSLPRNLGSKKRIWDRTTNFQSDSEAFECASNDSGATHADTSTESLSDVDDSLSCEPLDFDNLDDIVPEGNYGWPSLTPCSPVGSPPHEVLQTPSPLDDHYSPHVSCLLRVSTLNLSSLV